MEQLKEQLNISDQNLRDERVQAKNEMKLKDGNIKETSRGLSSLEKELRGKNTTIAKMEREKEAKEKEIKNLKEKHNAEMERVSKEKDQLLKAAEMKQLEMKREIDRHGTEVRALVSQMHQIKLQVPGYELQTNNKATEKDMNMQRSKEGPEEVETNEKMNKSTEEPKEEKAKDTKKEINKLKAEVTRYETRLESTLNELALKERALLCIMDDHEMVKHINKELEKQLASMAETQQQQIEVDSDEDDENNNMDIVVEEDSVKETANKIHKTSRICYHYKRNMCKWGDQCRFEHPDHEQVRSTKTKVHHQKQHRANSYIPDVTSET